MIRYLIFVSTISYEIAQRIWNFSHDNLHHLKTRKVVVDLFLTNIKVRHHPTEPEPAMYNQQLSKLVEPLEG